MNAPEPGDAQAGTKLDNPIEGTKPYPMWRRISDWIFRAFCWCFFVFCLIGGFALVEMPISDAFDANHRLSIAKRVPALITKVDEGRWQSSDSYTPQVAYKFSYDGKEWSPENWRLHDSDEFNTKEQADRLLQPYKVGDTVSAYVDPEDPNKSFLDVSFPQEYDQLYGKTAYGSFVFWVALSCIMALRISGRARKSGITLTDRDRHRICRTALLPWIIFCLIDMVWYWTHGSRPFAGASYWVAGISAVLGLLTWISVELTYALFMLVFSLFLILLRIVTIFGPK